MTALHDHFHNRNQQAFQRLVDASVDRAPGRGGPSTSAGKSKSWTRPSSLTSDAVSDINARDSRGRTVLHLACAATDSLEYVKSLLQHPSIDVNLPDSESHWTPLHRALYTGNIPAACVPLRWMALSDTNMCIVSYYCEETIQKDL
jgi:ankyrin repeat protein